MRRLTRWTRAERARRIRRRTSRFIGMLAVALAGASLGLLLCGSVQQDVGPFSATFALRPSLGGGTDVQIPPLGSLDVATHAGPAHLSVRLGSLDQRRAEALVTDPNGITLATQTAVSDVQRGITRLLLRASGVALLGALLLSALVYRSPRRVAMCGGMVMAVLLGTGLLAAATFNPRSVEEPQYHGLITNAPAVIGDARSIANRFGQYKEELQRLVDNVSRIYGTVSTLPTYQPDANTIRVLHVSDLHLNPSAWPIIATVVQQYQIQVVVDSGDIDDWGTQMESSFVDAIGSLKVPYVYIRGNHDSALTAAAVARQPNAIVLENSVTTVAGLTFAGIGDPRFTPDKQESSTDESVIFSGQELAATIRSSATPVDVAVVHDPASAPTLDGTVPLVLAGHLHARAVSMMPALHDATGTRLMIEGSTGGAGLRGLEGEKPTPLEMTVLYFSKSRTLEAYDEITVGGTGQANVTIQRHLATDGSTDTGDDTATASPSVSGSPPAGGASPTPPGAATPSPTPNLSPTG
jgi:predicted phosphodiesterase